MKTKLNNIFILFAVFMLGISVGALVQDLLTPHNTLVHGDPKVCNASYPDPCGEELKKYTIPSAREV